MLTIYFGNSCFREIESSITLLNCAKSETDTFDKFLQEAMDNLILHKEIGEEYRNRVFDEVDSRHGDVLFMLQMVDNMDRVVEIELEQTKKYYCMSCHEWNENFIIYESENSYTMLFWCTTA